MNDSENNENNESNDLHYGNVEFIQAVLDEIDDDVDCMNASTFAPLYSLSCDELPPQCVARSLSSFMALAAIDDKDGNNAPVASNDGSVRGNVLSSAEQLLVAQERRGLAVPDAATQARVLAEAHALGHFGEQSMYKYIETEGWWWPTVRYNIKHILSTCKPCQRYTIIHHSYAPARSITALRPSDHYQIDLMEMPVSLDGYKFALVLVDLFTGFVMVEPLRSKHSSVVARELMRMFCIIGFPKRLQSDNGKEFVNSIINSLCNLTGVSRAYIAAYNPRADGKVERAIGAIKSVLKKMLYGTTVLCRCMYRLLFLPIMRSTVS